MSIPTSRPDPAARPRQASRLLLIHPSELVRAGLASILASTLPATLVGSVASVGEAVALGPGRCPSLVLFAAPASATRETTGVVADLWTSARRIALATDDLAIAGECLAAGADAVVATPTVTRSGLIDLARSVVDGTTGALAGFDAATGGPRAGTMSPLAEVLTTRELEILFLIGEGLSNQVMAQRINLSPKTIETHRTKIGKKLGIVSRAGLIRFAMESFGVGEAAFA